MPAITRLHLKTGAQKNTVFGPAGCSHKGLNLPGTYLSTVETRVLYRAADMILITGDKEGSLITRTLLQFPCKLVALWILFTKSWGRIGKVRKYLYGHCCVEFYNKLLKKNRFFRRTNNFEMTPIKLSNYLMHQSTQQTNSEHTQQTKVTDPHYEFLSWSIVNIEVALSLCWRLNYVKKWISWRTMTLTHWVLFFSGMAIPFLFFNFSTYLPIVDK